MDRASASSLRLARALAQAAASPALRPAASRFLAPLFSSTAAVACRQPLPFRPLRPFSSTSAARSDEQSPKDGSSAVRDAVSSLGSSGSSSTNGAAARKPASSASLMEGLADLLPSPPRDPRQPGSAAAAAADGPISPSSRFSASALTGLEDFDRMKRDVDHSMDEYHFAVYSHRHNTHITVSKPNKDVILSLSCGNIGFRKAQRKSYDAAYQLGAYVCDKLYQNNWHKNIHKMRVTLRGFGAGREAVTKILLGTEGRLLRNKITQVADTTRLKFGGTRSPRPRRLG